MSISSTVRSLKRYSAARFPGAASTDVAEFLHLVLDAALDGSVKSIKDDDILAVADQKLVEATEKDEAWAVRLRDAVLLNVLGPQIRTAREKGVDPVAAVQLVSALSREEAEEAVAKYESMPQADDDDLLAGDAQAINDRLDDDN